MDLPDRAEARTWQGREVVDRDGASLGRCHGVFADTDTGVPEWVLVDVDDRRAFVPAGDAEQQDEQVRVQFSRDQVLSAPDVGDVSQLTEQDEQVLYTHYGVAFSTSESESVLPVDAAPEGDSTVTDSAAASTTTDTVEAPAPAPTPEPVAPSASRRVTAPAQETGPAPWAPRAVPPPASSGGSAVAPLAGLAGLVGGVWLVLRARDRRAAERRSLAGRTTGLRRQLAAGSSVLAELSQQAAARTQQAASGAAAGTADATRAGRSATRAAAREAAQAAARRSAAASKQAAKRRKELARTASGAGTAVTGSSRQLAKAAKRTSTAAERAVTDTGRELAQVATAAGSAVSGSRRQVAKSVSAVPDRASRRGRKVAKRGRKMRRSLARKLWDVVLLTAAGGGYVAGARAGEERYEEIAAWASRTAERPEVKKVVDTVTTTVTGTERGAHGPGSPLQGAGPQPR